MRLLLTIIAVLALAAPAAAEAPVTLRDILENPVKYRPPACEQSVCVLTGPGGLVKTWEKHVLAHRGYTFVVRGKCASSCEIAYQLARKLGERVVVEPGAKLIVHQRTPAIIE